MRNIFTSALVVSTLLLGVAGATSGGTMSNAQVSTSMSSSVRADVRAAVLLDAQGRTVGTLGGGSQFMTSGALSTATQVRVMLEGGASRTYTLAQSLHAQGMVSLESLVVRSGDGTASLGGAIRADLQTMHALSGKTVTLVSGSGSVVGTFMADGSLRVGGNLRQATRAVVTLEGGQQVTYDLAAQLTAEAGGTLQLGSVSVRDQGRGVALVSVLTTLRQTSTVTGDVKSSGSSSTSGSKSVSAGSTAQVSTSAATSGDSASGGISISVGGGIGIGIGGGK